MLLPVLAALTLAAAPRLSTVAEQSGFQRTGRYEEVVRLCDAFAQAYRGRVRCESFGTTPERRPMKALIASGDGTLTAEAARRKKRPVVLALGGIHAGEIDGKDAGFLLLRELLDGTLPASLLRGSTFVFVPVFNVDGHERFGPNNRPNQRGPVEMGWRTTAANLNLNRDWTKAEAPEMQALLGLLRAWDPILMLDLHVTDGAKFEHDVAVMLEPLLAGPEELRSLGRAAREAVFARLAAQGHLPLPFYPSFVKDDDPASGFAHGIAPPRFSQSYRAARNRFGVLVETHSWKEYPVRVKSTHDVMLAFLEQSAAQGATWLAAAERADRADESADGGNLVLAWNRGANPKQIEFRGYAYERKPSEISGEEAVRYDESTPRIWRIPLASDLSPAVTVQAPRRGYFVPTGFAELVGSKLAAHGFRFDPIRSPQRRSVDAFRATKVEFAPSSFEGRQALTLAGGWSKEEVELAPGSIFVPIAQPGRLLLAHLLDPQAPDSLGAWGYFNAAFEQKEYIEDYLIEDWARQALAADPKLREEFERRLKSDEAFAKSPEQRLRFFAMRHPAWDARLNLYPVYRD